MTISNGTFGDFALSFGRLDENINTAGRQPLILCTHIGAITCKHFLKGIIIRYLLLKFNVFLPSQFFTALINLVQLLPWFSHIDATWLKAAQRGISTALLYYSLLIAHPTNIFPAMNINILLNSKRILKGSNVILNAQN